MENCRGRIVEILGFEYLVLRKVKTGRTHKRFMDVEKEDVQVADMTEEDSRDTVRWMQMGVGSSQKKMLWQKDKNGIQT